MKTHAIIPFALSVLVVLAAGLVYAQDPPKPEEKNEKEKTSDLVLSLALSSKTCVIGDDLQMDVVLKNNGEPVELTDLQLEKRSLAFLITLDAEGKKVAYEWTVTGGNPHIANRLSLPRVTLAKGASLGKTLSIPMPVSGKAKIQARYEGAGKPLMSKEISFDVKPSEKGSNLGMLLDLGDNGSIMVKLLPRNAPRCVTHLIRLARRGFYNNINVHQIIKANWFKTGCPYGLGIGGPGFAVLSDVKDQKDKIFTKGTMALSGYEKLGYVGSQFFITSGKVPSLDGKYPIVGRVDVKNEKSMETLGKIDKTGTKADSDQPETDVIIRSCRIMVVE